MRNLYFDILKGIAILFVIAIHTYPISSAPIPQAPSLDSFWNVVSLMLRQFIVVAVPLFCTISGFFVGKKNKEECITFAQTKALPLYIPTLIWSLPFIFYDIYKGFGTIGHNIIKFFCCGYSIHYFIAIMLQFYLLMPLLVKTTNRKHLSIATLISLFSIGVFSYLMYVEGKNIPLYIYAGTLPIWIMFFCLGIYLSKRKRNYNILPFVVGAFIFLFLSIIETGCYINYYGQLSGIGYKVTSFIFSFFFIVILMSNKVEISINQSSTVAKFLAWLGRNSLGLYFFHYPLLVFVLCHINTTWMTEFALSLVVSIIAILFVKRFFPMSVAAYIGFR